MSSRARWLSVISSDLWEIPVLLVLYVSLRWTASTRSIAVTILGSACAAATNAIVFKFGEVAIRWSIFSVLAEKSYCKNKSILYLQNLNTLYGQYLAFSLLWGLPFYLIILPFWIVFALVQPCTFHDDSLSVVWRKLGGQTYKSVGKLYRKYLCRDKPKSFAVTSFPFHFISMLLSSLMFSTSSKIRVAFYVLILSPLLVCGIVGLLVWFAICFTFSIAYYIPFLISLAIVLVVGKHVSVLVVILLEVIATVLEVDLGTTKYEIIFLAAFIVPVLGVLLYLFSLRLFDAFHCALRHDLGRDHRLSKLTEIFYSIPVNSSEAALKVWDTHTGNSLLSAKRETRFFVVYVRGGEPNELRCMFVEAGEEVLIDGAPERNYSADLQSAIWSGEAL